MKDQVVDSDGGGEEISESHHLSLQHEFRHSRALGVCHIPAWGGAEKYCQHVPSKSPHGALEHLCTQEDKLRQKICTRLTQNYQCVDGVVLHNLQFEFCFLKLAKDIVKL